MKRKVFAVGDIHGGLKALDQLISKIEPNSEDLLIFLGDYVDGWSESAQVIDYLISLSQTQECLFIKGNHDIWCENWLRTGESDSVWLEHGGILTMESYEAYNEEQKKAHLRFFEDMLPFFIDEENRLFIHAGFTSKKGVEHEILKENYYFDRSLLEMAISLDRSMGKVAATYPPRLRHYSEIYIGHTPTLNYGKMMPIHAMNIIDVDTGAAFYGKLSAINVESKDVIQSDKVWDFYPDEQGRNR